MVLLKFDKWRFSSGQLPDYIGLMSQRTTWLALAFGAMSLHVGASPALADRPVHKPARSRTALAEALPPLDGDRLRATVLELTYEPGGSSPAHSHPCPVMVYVIEGAIRTKVKGQPETIYRAGQAFFEAPNGLHEVSANASDRAPAKFLAVFVCDRATPLTVQPPANRQGSSHAHTTE
jgi:quercetin dioxygenase-like cupin family protein